MSVESESVSIPVPRYALYYAPRPEEGLALAASQWLGRNAETGQSRPLKAVSAFTRFSSNSVAETLQIADSTE